MPPIFLIIGVVLLLAAIVSAIYAITAQSKLAAAQDEIQLLQGETSKVVAAEEQKAQLQQEVATLKENLVSSMSMIEDLQAEASQTTALKSNLEDTMRAELQSKDVTIEELKGKLTVNILNRILFDLGKAELKPEGKRVLKDVAIELEKFSNRQIYVAGHTDDIPFTSRSGRFRSNWELSAGRAVAAVEFLVNEAGVDPKRLAAVGFSQFHPIASNATGEGKAKNRRIALVIMPEDLDFTPEAPEEPAPTDSPDMTTTISNPSQPINFSTTPGATETGTSTTVGTTPSPAQPQSPIRSGLGTLFQAMDEPLSTTTNTSQ